MRSERTPVWCVALVASVLVSFSSGCADGGSSAAPVRLSSAQTGALPYSYPEAFCGDPWNPDPNEPFCRAHADADFFYFALFDPNDPEKASYVASLLQRADVMWTFQLVAHETTFVSPALTRSQLWIDVIPAEDGSIFGYVSSSHFCGVSEGDTVTPVQLDIFVASEGGEEELLLSTGERDPDRVYPVSWSESCAWDDLAKQEEWDETELPAGALEAQCEGDGDRSCATHEEITSLRLTSKSLELRRLIERIKGGASSSGMIETLAIGESGWNEKYTAIMDFAPASITVVEDTKAETFFEIPVRSLYWDGRRGRPSVGSFEWLDLAVLTASGASYFYFPVEGQSVVVTIPQ